MPERGAEVFSNPLPPAGHEHHASADSKPLSNEDFRKLLMTPKVASGSTAAPVKEAPVQPDKVVKDEFEGDEDDAATKRRKKKSYYAKLKKLEEEREKELAMKYRDRAKERRDGQNKDYEQTEMISTTADYRAVAPDAKSGETQAERRKQVIQESKYLGGDMEHTHLVKGLDYALLDKVRAEITSKETELLDDESLEKIIKEKVEEEEDEEAKIQFRSKMGRNIYRILFKNKLPERNELFLPKRMAYVVDLDDEFDTDIPTTLIRSKADCPSVESTTTLTTNDIVINKLTQILSYLRQGRRDAKKLKKKEKGKLLSLKDLDKVPKGPEESIYEGVGEYAGPTLSKDKDRDRKDRDKRDKDRDRDRRDRARDRDRRDRDRDRRDRDREKKKSYFEKPAEEDISEKAPTSATDLVKSINDKFSKGWAPADLEREEKLRGAEGEQKEDSRQKKIKKKIEIDSYAECYPGMLESADAIDDSDDEVDYTKMDQGNKKGPVGRWDFDTQEEYSDYMSNKEALPKAAFQYGVKMADGRKTRRTGPKDEKRELDREWQKIQNLIQKRKNMGTEGHPHAKQPKY